MIIIDDKNNDISVNDENNDNNNKVPTDSPHKGPIMLSFDATFVECENNSRVSSDLRRHVPHIYLRNTVMSVLMKAILN